MKNFEMANADNPEEMIMATQRSIIKCAKEVLGNIRKDTKAPGLTWEQLDYFLDQLANKKPTIIHQEHEQ